MTLLGLLLIALGLLIIKGAFRYRKIERKLGLRIDRNVEPLSDRDRQIKERIETMNHRAACVLEARQIIRLSGAGEYPVDQLIRRPINFN